MILINSFPHFTDDEGIEPAWKKLKQANRMDHHTDVEKQKYAASTEPVGFYEKPADLEVPEGVEMVGSVLFSFNWISFTGFHFKFVIAIDTVC